MKQWFKHWTKRMLFIMALMGPGIITAIADNDAAGISTYTLAASSFGYQILIILIPMTILLAVTQEIGARIAIVAEKDWLILSANNLGYEWRSGCMHSSFLLILSSLSQTSLVSNQHSRCLDLIHL